MTALLPCCESTSGGSINMFHCHNYLFKIELNQTYKDVRVIVYYKRSMSELKLIFSKTMRVCVFIR